jgi:hypothetical protein
MSAVAPAGLEDRLNQDCFCIGVDGSQVWRAVAEAARGVAPVDLLSLERPHLFSSAPVFLSRSDLSKMEAVVEAVERLARLPSYRAAALAEAPATAQADSGTLGAFMGYDFHITAEGPRLIEINTNAGGAFLNALLSRAQAACCPDVAAAIAHDPAAGFETAVLRMFEEEWRRGGRTGSPKVVAIVDQDPGGQYLYPEFLLAQALFEQHGMEAIILDPKALDFDGEGLRAGGRRIDLVYNRLCDFALDAPESLPLRQAHNAGAVILTPNPHHHALLADKRNLVRLSDPELLRQLGDDAAARRLMRSVLQAQIVTPENAALLWERRRRLFFKPYAGFAGKAVYRGDKLTRAVWAEILQGGYIAQEAAPPSERRVRIDETPQARKMDVRLYTYGGKMLLPAARLYSGQTTNFRTPGGGFAPVIVLDR